jgi:hypothetical protein
MQLIRLGKTSKMSGFSFGLDARDCVTGSKLREIKGSVCSKCYALKGNFNFPSVRKGKATNLKHLESEYFVYVMTYQLQDQKFFRWFDSGDLPHMEALKKIVTIAENTPHTKHWLPTREIKLIQEYLRNNKFPKNLVVRVSGTMIDGQPPKGFQNTSTVHKDKDPIGFDCPSRFQNNQCLSCTACWDKRIKNISYKAH